MAEKPVPTPPPKKKDGDGGSKGPAQPHRKLADGKTATGETKAEGGEEEKKKDVEKKTDDKSNPADATGDADKSKAKDGGDATANKKSSDKGDDPSSSAKAADGGDKAASDPSTAAATPAAAESGAAGDKGSTEKKTDDDASPSTPAAASAKPTPTPPKKSDSAKKKRKKRNKPRDKPANAPSTGAAAEREWKRTTAKEEAATSEPSKFERAKAYDASRRDKSKSGGDGENTTASSKRRPPPGSLAIPEDEELAPISMTSTMMNPMPLPSVPPSQFAVVEDAQFEETAVKIESFLADARLTIFGNPSTDNNNNNNNNASSGGGAVVIKDGDDPFQASLGTGGLPGLFEPRTEAERRRLRSDARRRTELSNLPTTKAALYKELCAARQRRRKAEGEYVTTRAKNAELRERLKTLQDKTAENSRLQAELESTRGQLQRLKSGANQNAERQRRAFDRELAQRELQLKQAHEAAMHQERESWVRKTEQVEARCQSLISENMSLHERNQSLKDDLVRTQLSLIEMNQSDAQIYSDSKQGMNY